MQVVQESIAVALKCSAYSSIVTPLNSAVVKMDYRHVWQVTESTHHQLYDHKINARKIEKKQGNSSKTKNRTEQCLTESWWHTLILAKNIITIQSKL